MLQDAESDIDYSMAGCCLLILPKVTLLQKPLLVSLRADVSLPDECKIMLLKALWPG